MGSPYTNRCLNKPCLRRDMHSMKQVQQVPTRVSCHKETMLLKKMRFTNRSRHSRKMRLLDDLLPNKIAVLIATCACSTVALKLRLHKISKVRCSEYESSGMLQPGWLKSDEAGTVVAPAWIPPPPLRVSHRPGCPTTCSLFA